MKTDAETDIELEAKATPFILIQDDQDKNTSQNLSQLKSGVLVLGVVLGFTLQSVAWALGGSVRMFLRLEDVGRWFDLLFTLVSFVILPMIVMEMIRIVVRTATRMASTKVDEDVLHKVLLHVQSRMGVGVLCGVLLTLPILDFNLGLWHHLLHTIKVAAVVSMWCCYLEERILDDAATIRMSSALQENEDDPTISVF